MPKSESESKSSSKHKFVFESDSDDKLLLLRQAGFEPDIVTTIDVDTTAKKREKPLDYIKRIAIDKLLLLQEKYFGDIILCAHTIASSQARIIQKCETNEEVRFCLQKYSGRSISVFTSICLLNSEHKISQKTLETSIKFKHLSDTDIAQYVDGKYGLHRVGAINPHSLMEAFILKIIGSHSSLQGLPLYQARNMLISAGVV